MLSRLEEQLALLEALQPTSSMTIASALEGILWRAIETRLASHPMLSAARLGVGGFPTEIVVATLLQEVGWDGVLPEWVLADVRQMTEVGRGQSASLRRVDDGTVITLLRQYRKTRGVELRCENCGFHFRAQDLATDDRRAKCTEAGLVLADSLDRRRSMDRMKSHHFTALQIDHVIPRSGWGPSSVTNLRVLCSFCNQGKGFAQFPWESLSAIVGLSLSDWNAPQTADSVDDETTVQVRQGHRRLVAYTSLSASGGVCQHCGSSVRERELTVFRVSETDEWKTPIGFEVTCYDCHPVLSKWGSVGDELPQISSFGDSGDWAEPAET